MSDARLRELARHLGDRLAEARLLRERVRVGDLTEERLRLAAHLGGEAALLAADADPGDGHMERWITGLAAWGQEPCVRAVAAAARAALPEYEQVYFGSTSFRAALEAADEWLRSGGATPAPPILERPEGAGRVVFGAASAVVRLAQAIRSDSRLLPPRQRGAHRTPAAVAARFAFLGVNDARMAIGRENVVRAIQRSLVPWALRSNDELRAEELPAPQGRSAASGAPRVDEDTTRHRGPEE